VKKPNKQSDIGKTHHHKSLPQKAEMRRKKRKKESKKPKPASHFPISSP
jgi:hypothetical protein